MTQRVPNLQFPGLTNNGLKFISPHLRVGISVYPSQDSSPFIPNRGTKARQIDWDVRKTEASIIQFQWVKQMGQPAGSWSMVMKANPQYDTSGLLWEGVVFDDQMISDGDWVDIAVLRNGIRIPICRGIIDSVRKKTVSVRGATAATYMITGRDHGAFFEYPLTWNNIFARTISEGVSGFATNKLKIVGGRPDQLFSALIAGWFKGNTNAGQWILPQALSDLTGLVDKKLFDLLEVVTFNFAKGQQGLRGLRINEQLWTVGEQSLFQTLAQWTNPILNEVWFDLLPPGEFLPPHGLAGFLSNKFFDRGKLPTIAEVLGESEAQTISSQNKKFGAIAAIIRERPFPNRELKKESMWFHLPTWVIPTWLLTEVDLGRGGAQRYNLFDMITDFGLGPQGEQQALAKPQWRKDDISKRGLRTYQPTTPFLGPDKKGFGEWFDEREKWLNLLVDWFAPNPYLLQGTVTVKTPLPEIRIGHRVILDNGDPKQQIQAYVEGVSIAFSAPTTGSGAAGQTQLILTRGFRGSDDELMNKTSALGKLHQEVL